MVDHIDVPADLLQRLRGVRLDASALAHSMRDLGLRLRYALRRRRDLRAAPELRRHASRRRWREAGKVVLVAATILVGVALGDAVVKRLTGPAPLGEVILPVPAASARMPAPDVPVADYADPIAVDPTGGEPHGAESGFFADLRELLADAGSTAAMRGLPERDALDSLRAQFRQRFSREERRRALAASGADPDREDRIQDLARVVASDLEAQIHPPTDDDIRPRSVFDLALGLRALLAAGSSRAVGEHRQVVRDTTDALLAELEVWPGDEAAASILAALSDVAVVSGGKISEVVRRGVARLAAATLDFAPRRSGSPHGASWLGDPGQSDSGPRVATGGERPTLLHWQTRAASLADAGQVLALAPAFGAPTATCARARRLILRHLEERLSGSTERPDVIAAMLYGFGDLVDRNDLDRRLLMWRPQRLWPNYVALYHYAWGQYPLRPGWTQFQQDLRWVTAQHEPEAVTDNAALLLTLAMNFAAPGAPEMLLARR